MRSFSFLTHPHTFTEATHSAAFNGGCTEWSSTYSLNYTVWTIQSELYSLNYTQTCIVKGVSDSRLVDSLTFIATHIYAYSIWSSKQMIGIATWPNPYSILWNIIHIEYWWYQGGMEPYVFLFISALSTKKLSRSVVKKSSGACGHWCAVRSQSWLIRPWWMWCHEGHLELIWFGEMWCHRKSILRAHQCVFSGQQQREQCVCCKLSRLGFCFFLRVSERERVRDVFSMFFFFIPKIEIAESGGGERRLCGVNWYAAKHAVAVQRR